MNGDIMKQIVLGGGCFWCLEASYQLIAGVNKVVPGYAGGDVKNPSYERVSSGNSGHVEVVRVEFDEDVISLADILDIFWAIHDPTTPNRQGADVGPQYRSAIFYQNNEQKSIAKKSILEAQKLWKDPIVTNLEQLDTFYEAEEYHHNYFKNNPSRAYCQVVINPKLDKLRKKYSQLIT